MLLFLRRFLVLIALMFWLGGFTFYAAIVVPIGQRVLGSHLAQGLITRQVTNYLNLSGAIALVILGWEVAAARDPSNIRRWTRWLSWAGMVGFLLLLVWLHPQLDALLEVEEGRLLDARSFRVHHRWYLWLSTFQWALGLLYTGLTISTWRREDRTEEGFRNEKSA